MTKTLKKRMLEGESVFGTWCMLPSGAVVDVIARTGIDFVIIDLEHGNISWETAEEMVRAAQLHDCQPIIRVGDDDENTILHALETDCRAVMIPHVSTVDSAKRIVRASRYSPRGSRGLSPYTRCHGYTHDGLAESLEYHAKETLVGILVEGVLGIKNLSEIVKVDGIDLIYLGMYDISQSVGLPGQLEHPEVVAQLEYCLEIISAGNKLAGTFARDIDAAIEFKELGFPFVAYVADSYALTDFYQAKLRKTK
jgi:4-hydroxy-2-oxoheptanedioate aldolase